MKSYWFTTGFRVLEIGLLLTGLGAVQAQDRPNILWIVAEDISPLFGCYGDVDAATPHIDKLAEQSHVFLRAYATAPICAPSRSCLATGMVVTSLGSQNLRSEVTLPQRIKPLVTLFREQGYWTSLRGKTGYNFDPQGLFDYWKQDTAPWQQCPKEKPFFAFMNLGSTHAGGNHYEPLSQGIPPGTLYTPDNFNLR